MEIRYNLYNLEASFKNYLLAGNKSPVTVKNYLSDLRHFLGWLIFKFKVSPRGRSSSGRQSDDESVINLIQFISPALITEYQDYLVENRIPEKTVKRRLSTLRKFCSYCIDQGWMKENPAKKISNIKYQISNLNTDQILKQFQIDLIKEKIDRPIINNYLDDVREFFSI